MDHCNYFVAKAPKFIAKQEATKVDALKNLLPKSNVTIFRHWDQLSTSRLYLGIIILSGMQNTVTPLS